MKGNRDIRFRAWDGQQMYYQVQAGGFKNTSPTVYVERDGVCEWVHATPETVVMQYTGLKDQDGKEIYEGDILKHIHGWQGPLVFRSGRVGPCVGDNVMEYTIGEVHNLWNQDEVEIIGNIYENGDLLK